VIQWRNALTYEKEYVFTITPRNAQQMEQYAECTTNTLKTLISRISSTGGRNNE